MLQACEPIDINIVLERMNLPAAGRFDLMVGTNIFVYYGPRFDAGAGAGERRSDAETRRLAAD